MGHNKKVRNEENGIKKITQNDIEYIVWTDANIAIPYVRRYLANKFPNKLIVSELNQIDLSIPECNLPVEIQSTCTNWSYINFATWEDRIRRQIEQDLTYGKCWFFFDSELLRAMKNIKKGVNTGLNMDWFRKLMKEEKLMVFTINYNGIVEQKGYKDFDFISEISQTCPVAAETDEMILNRNKMEIFTNVVKGYSFTPEEIYKFEIYCKKCRQGKKEDEGRHMRELLIAQSENPRAMTYGYVLHAISHLPAVNKLLCGDMSDTSLEVGRSVKKVAKILGFFDVRGSGYKVFTTFIDRFDVCKYFPGYLRNKERWDKIKGRPLGAKQFRSFTLGEDTIFYGLDHHFPEIKEENNNIEEDRSQEKIECKTQIAIKTTQKIIDDAW